MGMPAYTGEYWDQVVSCSDIVRTGRSDRIQTSELVVPNDSRYQLRHTRKN